MLQEGVWWVLAFDIWWISNKQEGNTEYYCSFILGTFIVLLKTISSSLH